jgi:hypothetical protein
LRLGYFATSHTHSPSSGWVTALSGKSWATGHHRDKDVQCRSLGHQSPLCRDIDATFIGPNPAINGYIQSGGEALRIVVALPTAALMSAKPRRRAPEDLDGKKIAPTGSTQDVAFRAGSGQRSGRESGSDVMQPIANADTLSLFSRAADGARCPAVGHRLMQEAGGSAGTSGTSGRAESTLPLVVAPRTSSTSAPTSSKGSCARPWEPRNGSTESWRQGHSELAGQGSPAPPCPGAVIDAAWNIGSPDLSHQPAQVRRGRLLAGLPREKPDLSGICAWTS